MHRLKVFAPKQNFNTIYTHAFYSTLVGMLNIKSKLVPGDAGWCREVNGTESVIIIIIIIMKRVSRMSAAGDTEMKEWLKTEFNPAF